VLHVSSTDAHTMGAAKNFKTQVENKQMLRCSTAVRSTLKITKKNFNVSLFRIAATDSRTWFSTAGPTDR
jgi:hypothetical protein